jgi:hypothetical protein
MKLWRKKTFGQVVVRISGPPWGFDIRARNGDPVVAGRNPRWSHGDACASAAIQAEMFADGPLFPLPIAETVLAIGLASAHDLAVARTRISRRKRTY